MFHSLYHYRDIQLNLNNQVYYQQNELVLMIAIMHNIQLGLSIIVLCQQVHNKVLEIVYSRYYLMQQNLLHNILNYRD